VKNQNFGVSAAVSDHANPPHRLPRRIVARTHDLPTYIQHAIITYQAQGVDLGTKKGRKILRRNPLPMDGTFSLVTPNSYDECSFLRYNEGPGDERWMAFNFPTHGGSSANLKRATFGTTEKEIWIPAWEAVADYMTKRANGTNSDNPPRTLPMDGQWSWDDPGALSSKVRYDEGREDKKWMEERDSRYIARLECEGRLQAEEPEVYRQRHPNGGSSSSSSSSSSTITSSLPSFSSPLHLSLIQPSQSGLLQTTENDIRLQAEELEFWRQQKPSSCSSSSFSDSSIPSLVPPALQNPSLAKLRQQEQIGLAIEIAEYAQTQLTNQRTEIQEQAEKQQLLEKKLAEERAEKARLAAEAKQLSQQLQEMHRQWAQRGEISTMIPPEIPQAYICPITSEIMREPVVDREGHTFERSEIERWVINHHTCPLNPDAHLELTDLAPNFALRDAIGAFLTANPTLRPAQTTTTTPPTPPK